MKREFVTAYLSLSQIRLRLGANRAMYHPMGDMLKLIWWARGPLKAEILTLRHQPNVLGRNSPERLAFSNFDPLVFARLYRIAPRAVNALVFVKSAFRFAILCHGFSAIVATP